MPSREGTRWTGLGIFVLVMVVQQVFLLAVGLEALLAGDTAQAWTTAALSLGLGAASIAFYLFYRRR